MAWVFSRLCTHVPRSTFLSILTRTLPQFYSKFEIDVIDDFTSQLLQRKIEIWDLKKRKSETLVEDFPKNEKKQISDIDLKNLDSEQVGVLFQNAMDNDDNECVYNLVDYCIIHKKSPPFSILINVLSTCSQNGEKVKVHQICELCRMFHPEVLEENSDFQHFVAEAIWVKGDTSKALQLFEKVYRENAYLRRRIRLMLKCLIGGLVSNRGEAALWNTINFSESISRDFQDYFPLTCVWQACFLSEWFTDQCLALELLQRNPGLCKSVVNRIPYVVFVSLKCHRTEVVYRLLEILNQFKMKNQCSNVLVTLLDYQFRRGDLRSCSEIFKWAIKNNITIPSIHHIRLIRLLLNRKVEVQIDESQSKIGEKPEHNYKF